MKYLRITYWTPRKLRCQEKIYNIYCDISEKDETIEELTRLGYKYEIEIIEEYETIEEQTRLGKFEIIEE